MSVGPDNDSITFPQAMLPASTSSRSYVPVSGSQGYGRFGVAGRNDIVTAWNDADGFATASLTGTTGTAGLYARAGGFPPIFGPPNDVFAEASVTVIRNYRITGPMATALVDVDNLFDGFLYVSSNGGIGNETAFVHFELSVEDATLGLIPLFSATASLVHNTGFTTSATIAGGFSNANYLASWANNSSTLTRRNGQDVLYELAYLERFNDIVTLPTNTDVALHYTMTTRATTPLPAELFATADFSHTGEFRLTSNDPNVVVTEVNLQVPEPGGLPLLLCGFAALASGWSRRGSRLAHG